MGYDNYLFLVVGNGTSFFGMQMTATKRAIWVPSILFRQRGKEAKTGAPVNPVGEGFCFTYDIDGNQIQAFYSNMPNCNNILQKRFGAFSKID